MAVAAPLTTAPRARSTDQLASTAVRVIEAVIVMERERGATVGASYKLSALLSNAEPLDVK